MKSVAPFLTMHIFDMQSDLTFQGKRYYKRYIKLLALYTDLELCASIRGDEYDINIAERLVLNYQTYLDVSLFLSIHFIPFAFRPFSSIVINLLFQTEFKQFNGTGCIAEYNTIVSSTSWHIGVGV